MNPENKIEDYRRAAKIHRGIAVLYFIFILIFGYLGVQSGQWFMALMSTVVFLIHLSAYYGLNRNKTWAKVLSGIVAFALLFGFPIGTILGGFILYYMFRTTGKTVSRENKPVDEVSAG